MVPIDFHLGVHGPGGYILASTKHVVRAEQAGTHVIYEYLA